MGAVKGIVLAAAAIAAFALPALGLDMGPNPPPPQVPPEVAWQERLEQQLARVEMELTALDRKKPKIAPKLLERVQAAHARIVDLEKAAKLEVGTIRGRAPLSDITSDIAAMHTRIKALIDARKPKPKGGVPPKPKPSAPEPKPDPRPNAPAGWPSSLRFPAKAKVLYEETGEWFITKIRHSGLGPDFLMDGYRGVVSLSISAAGLRAPVASAELIVAMQLKPPLADDDDTYRVYEITWNSSISSSGTFGNDSLKNLPAYDEILVRGPIGWIEEPRKVTTSFPCTAHVASVTLKSGEVIRFQTPQFEAKR